MLPELLFLREQGLVIAEWDVFKKPKQNRIKQKAHKQTKKKNASPNTNQWSVDAHRSYWSLSDWSSCLCVPVNSSSPVTNEMLTSRSLGAAGNYLYCWNPLGGLSLCNVSENMEQQTVPVPESWCHNCACGMLQVGAAEGWGPEINEVHQLVSLWVGVVGAGKQKTQHTSCPLWVPLITPKNALPWFVYGSKRQLKCAGSWPCLQWLLLSKILVSLQGKGEVFDWGRRWACEEHFCLFKVWEPLEWFPCLQTFWLFNPLKFNNNWLQAIRSCVLHGFPHGKANLKNNLLLFLLSVGCCCWGVQREWGEQDSSCQYTCGNIREKILIFSCWNQLGIREGVCLCIYIRVCVWVCIYVLLPSNG